MSGEKDLAILLASIAPSMDPEVYTYATVSDSESEQLERPFGVLREAEGVSMICLLRDAQALGWKYEGAFRKITLTVHSSLHAVGLTARVSTALADAGIPCNVVAGFYHDHLFVPIDRADEAKELLLKLR